MKLRVMTIMLLMASALCAQGIKRDRGDNLYQLVSANTMGKGNIWVEGQATGFIWDNDKKLRLFPQLEVRYGIMDFIQFKMYSRVLSYGFKPGFVTGELKATLPNNKNIRFWGIGLALQYELGLLSDNKSSLGGYRIGATGFFPEGFSFQSGSTNIILANDFDFIALSSYLPFTLYLNTGYSIANDSRFSKYNQYIIRAGIDYKGVGVDFFLEYSLKTFSSFLNPFLSDMIPGPSNKFVVWGQENEMYITPGARIRYQGGLTLYGAASLLLSKNKGSEWIHGDTKLLPQDERTLGATDGFTPFYVNWKVIASISYPIRYRQPSSEMYRSFLLQKNVKTKKKIDIDEKLDNEKNREGDSESKEEQERLKKIEDRKKKVMDEVILD